MVARVCPDVHRRLGPAVS